MHFQYSVLFGLRGSSVGGPVPAVVARPRSIQPSPKPRPTRSASAACPIRRRTHPRLAAHARPTPGARRVAGGPVKAKNSPPAWIERALRGFCLPWLAPGRSSDRHQQLARTAAERAQAAHRITRVPAEALAEFPPARIGRVGRGRSSTCRSSPLLDPPSPKRLPTRSAPAACPNRAERTLVWLRRSALRNSHAEPAITGPQAGGEKLPAPLRVRTPPGAPAEKSYPRRLSVAVSGHRMNP
jgi:hypothetical protein